MKLFTEKEPNLEMEKATSKTRLISIATGDVETSLVAFKARAFPLKRRVVVRSNGPDEDRQQIHGAVEAVQDGPRDLTWQHGEDIVDAEGDF